METQERPAPLRSRRRAEAAAQLLGRSAPAPPTPPNTPPPAMEPVPAQNVMQPRDYVEACALERQRREELQLQSRWFNPRERMIGGDYKAWTAQVHDRKIQEATRKGKHETFGAEMRQNDRIACLLEERERRDRRSLEEALTEFRQTFQKPEDRREFDLSDPLALRKDVPARVSDQDVSNTISGLQKFMGEDLNVAERKRAQQEQNREWLLEQRRSQNHALADLKLAEDTFTDTRLEFDQTAMNLQKLELDTRRAVCAAVKDFNKIQVLDVAERKRLEHRQEEEDNMVEISNILRSNFLRPHGPFVDKWKGHAEQIQQFQKQQMHQKQRLQEEEKQRDFDWDRQQIQAARANILFERQQRRLHRELRQNLDNENLNLAREHKNLQDYLKEQVYTNYLTDEYFTQFNTTSK